MTIWDEMSNADKKQSLRSFGQSGAWAADTIDAHEARVKTLEDRLEISHAYDIAGNKVPFPEGGPDGIECRNETIRLLETRIKVLEEALRAIIERWDTPNWKDAEHTGAVINRARAALEGK